MVVAGQGGLGPAEVQQQVAAMGVQHRVARLQRQRPVIVRQGLLQPPQRGQQGGAVDQGVEEAGVDGQRLGVVLQRLVVLAQMAQAVGQVAVSGGVAGMQRDRAAQAGDAALEIPGLEGHEPEQVVGDGVARVGGEDALEDLARLGPSPLLEQAEALLQRHAHGRGGPYFFSGSAGISPRTYFTESSVALMRNLTVLPVVWPI